jgi:hypothetical protein
MVASATLQETINGEVWLSLVHAYGPATDVPNLVGALLSERPEVCGSALANLHVAVLYRQVHAALVDGADRLHRRGDASRSLERAGPPRRQQDVVGVVGPAERAVGVRVRFPSSRPAGRRRRRRRSGFAPGLREVLKR